MNGIISESNMFNKSKAVFRLLRAKHWIKNALIYIPLLFSGLFFSVDLQKKLICGFICFSLSASSIYIINDIRDVELDKKHPLKKDRPIPSGEINKAAAGGILGVLILLTLLVFFFAGLPYVALLMLLIYVALNIFYSIGFKNFPIIDVMILSSGYVIRVFYGASICGVKNSGDLILTIIAISMWMGFGKRRGELINLDENARREVLNQYSYEFLDKSMYCFFILSITFYSLWARGHVNEKMIWTIPIVLFLGLRYIFNIEKRGYGDPVEIIFSDIVLILGGTAYLFIVIMILYCFK